MDFQQEEYPGYKNIEVLRFEDRGFVETIRPVVEEVPLTIYLNDHEIVTLLCLGDYLKSLAVGFLRSEGLITERRNLRSVFVDEKDRTARVEVDEDTDLAERLFMRRTITSGCGKGTTFYSALDALSADKIESPLQITTDQVFDLMQRLGRKSGLYKLTGGTHNSALATAEDLVFFRTDIGRHNAVDKITGECFLQDIPLQDKILLTTGRVSSEILIKTARLGIPILISRSAATGLAVSLARQMGVTLVGFARAKSLTIYAGRERIVKE